MCVIRALFTQASTKTKPKITSLVKRNKPISNCKPLECVRLGQVLLCKMRGWTEWPAKVIDVNGNEIEVRFFGDSKTLKTNIRHLFGFEENYLKIMSDLQRLKDLLYQRAVREAEIELNIPFELSILNKIA